MWLCLPLWLGACGNDDNGSPQGPSPAGGAAPAESAANVEDSGDNGDDGASTVVSPATDGEPDTARPYKACELSTRIGGFKITPGAGERYAFTGEVRDGVNPAQVPAVTMQAEVPSGHCELREPQRPFCDPECVPGQVCSEAGCVAIPGVSDVGTVVVSGLAEALELSPTRSKYYQAIDLPEAGTLIGVEASEAPLSGRTLRAVAVAPLETELKSVHLEPGMPVEVRWKPASASEATPDAIAVELELNLTNHGGNTGSIVCRTNDSGELALPVALTDALYHLGVTGFPSLTIARQSADALDTDLGCVDLTVGSEAPLGVEIPGVVSCSTVGSGAECPDGQTCGVDLICE